MFRARRLGCSGLVAAGAMVVGAGAGAAAADGSSRVYLVRDGSDYRRACFEPCRCNLDWRDSLQGRFTLTRGAAEPGVQNFTVSGARLAAPTLGEVYSGAGTYQRGEGPPVTNRLELDLSTTGFAEHFDSGPAVRPPPVAGGAWPVVSLTINYNQFECHDTVFGIVASRVGDWDASGEATLGDVFAFLADYFAGTGDVDGDGATSVNDVFAFLADYFDPA